MKLVLTIIALIIVCITFVVYPMYLSGYDFFTDLFDTNRDNPIWIDVLGSCAMILSIIVWIIQSYLIIKIYKR